MYLTTYQSRINSKCLSTALSCVIQSPLPCICASKIWPCIAEVWSQLETLTENERWEPFIFNSQKSTELARTDSSRRLQTWIHKEDTRSFEDHITCPLECRVKIPQKWKLWRWGMEDRGSWLERFLKNVVLYCAYKKSISKTASSCFFPLNTQKNCVSLH